MPKKSRRTRAKYRAAGKLAKGGAGKHIPPQKPTSEPKTSVSSVEPSPSPAQVARYQYVLPELRRIGIIAGALCLILIVLTFILG
ncbi:MAG TPA: hypothetical protein G4O12_02800 [Dehalococcoidia bacterium]|nr:hypothetical protein [Dehalococcoidia bacterium]